MVPPPCSDDCNEVRRKIRLLQKEPGFKVMLLLLSGAKMLTGGGVRVDHALAQGDREHQQQLFPAVQYVSCLPVLHALGSELKVSVVKASGPTGGAGNGTYYAA